MRSDLTSCSKTLATAAVALLVSSAAAQTVDLPRVKVTAPLYAEHHGGYMMSGDFKVDQRMPYVVFPAQALVKDDVLSVRPLNLNDDEYLVLQECASADCSTARLVRVWYTNGAIYDHGHDDDRITISHENKYFIWLKRLPVLSVGALPGLVAGRFLSSGHFLSFERYSPPMVLTPDGIQAATAKAQLQAQANDPPIPVAHTEHEGSSFVVTYQGGSTVRIKRMHADG